MIRHIDSGSQGHIFEVEDLEDHNTQLVIKISEFLDSLPKEIQAIERIKEVAAQSNSDSQWRCDDIVPEIKSYGMLQLKDFAPNEARPHHFSYYIMKKYQFTALEHFKGMSAV